MAFRNFFPPRLIIPTSFQDCLTYGQQLLWLLQHKSPELVAGNNITLEFNDQDHTVTVNAEGGGAGHTYHIDPESIEGGIEYRLIDENGDIQGFVFVPTVHTYSLDTIVDQETGYTQYCVVDENGTQCGVSLEPHMVPAGGSQGQVLAKTSGADYAYGWQDKHDIPAGGNANQVLKKSNNTDYAAEWGSVNEVPTGGTEGQVLTRTSVSDEYVWQTPQGGSGATLTQQTFNNTFSSSQVRFYYTYVEDSGYDGQTSASKIGKFSCQVSVLTQGNLTSTLVDNFYLSKEYGQSYFGFTSRKTTTIRRMRLEFDKPSGFPTLSTKCYGICFSLYLNGTFASYAVGVLNTFGNSIRIEMILTDSVNVTNNDIITIATV